MPERVFAVATGNRHKIEEIQAVLGPLGIRAITADEAIRRSGAGGADRCSGAVGGRFVMPEETGTTFEENARIKADALAAAVGIGHKAVDGFIADDSGLCVDALDGAPGVYSARYAGTGVDTDNTRRLLCELDGVLEDMRTARFICVITLIVPEDAGGGLPDAMVFRGECEGRITTAPRGHSGFGYDPVFVPKLAEDTMCASACAGRTFAEMTPEEKNRISHRARALVKLHEALSQGSKP